MCPSSQGSWPRTQSLWFALLLCSSHSLTTTVIALSSRRWPAHDTLKFNAKHWLDLARSHTKRAARRGDSPELSCTSRYGAQYIERWRHFSSQFCQSDGSAPGTPGSTMYCSAHPASDLSACSGHNIILNSIAFMGPKTPRELPSPMNGSVLMHCQNVQQSQSYLRGRTQKDGLRQWLQDAPQMIAAEQLKNLCSPNATSVIQHTVLFLMREDTTNAFHNLEHVISVFAALAVLELGPASFRQCLQVNRLHAGMGFIHLGAGLG